MQNYHLLIVEYVPPGKEKSSKVRITSPLYSQTVLIPFNLDSMTSQFSASLQIAEVWLTERGFKCVGAAEGNGKAEYIMSNTFNQLPKQ